MKIISKIALLTAGFLLFIHIFIPHNHARKTTQQTVESLIEDVSLFSIFSFVVNFDLGANHLNNFIDDAPEIQRNIQNGVASIILFSSPLEPLFIPFAKKLNLVTFSYSSFIDFSFDKNSLFRGPPSFL